MAALVLSVAGAAAGSAVLGPIGAIVGWLVGAVAGSVIDRALFGARNFLVDGPRLADLTVMTSIEGAAIGRQNSLFSWLDSTFQQINSLFCRVGTFREMTCD